MSYTRLSFIEREEISRQVCLGLSIRTVANTINRSPSTVSREINANVAYREYYRAVHGQQRAKYIRRKKRRMRRLDQNHELRAIVMQYIFKKWSPQQIANRLKVLYPENMDMHISHEAIYSYIYILPRGELRRNLTLALRKKHTHRRTKKPVGQTKPGAVQEFLSIEERPKEVADRIIPGHWEGDLIIGTRNNSALGVLVERTTRMTFLVKLANQDAITVRKAFVEEFKELPTGLRKTLTYDQGREMAQHKIFTEQTEMNVYFAHPKSPWERGTNENTNGLLRQYFPKGTDFNIISKNHLKEVQDEFNDRPRKTLNWLTPHEKFTELLR